MLRSRQATAEGAGDGRGAGVRWERSGRLTEGDILETQCSLGTATL